MRNPFTAHPREFGEGYLEHCLFAMRYGVKMTLGGLAAIVHGLAPFLFQSTGSRITRELNRTLDESRARAAARREDGA
jgi:hypothetical protein